MKKSFYYAIIFSQLTFFICLPLFQQLFSYLHPVVIIVLWMGMTVGISFLVFLFRRQSICISSSPLLFGLLAYTLCLIILLFFRPGEQTYDSWNLVPFSTIGFYLSGNVNPLIAFYNLAANIGLFIPFGIALMLLVKSKLMKFIIPFLAISTIELLQFITNRGSLDIDDLILNK